MHEILTLSLSQRANYLTTHFYNAQESYIDYQTPLSKQINSKNDVSIHFKPTISSNSINYTPRVLLWDLNGGYGSLGQFEYFQNEQQHDDIKNDVSKHTTISKSRINKNQYQKSLDEGKSYKLKNDDIKYFTDFSRLIFEPKSFNYLQNWEFDPINYPNGRLTFGKEREFIGYNVGIEEFKNENIGIEFMEEKYRISLEECDLLNGINIISELDSSWSGFSIEVLNILKDDYNPKSEIFSYLLFNGESSKLTNKMYWDRIQGFLNFQKESSLIFPINSQLGYSSLWETSASQNVVFESLQVLGSQTLNRKTFHEFESSLTLGNSHRNIISKINWKSGETNVDLSSSFFELRTPSSKKSSSNSKIFSETTILRPSRSCNFQEFIESNPSDPKDRTNTKFFSNIPFATPDSFPDDIIYPKDNHLQVEFAVESKIKSSIKDMKEFVSRFIKGDERSDAIDSLSSLASEYESGYFDSDEESDDDY